MNAPLDLTFLAGRRVHLGVCGSIAAYKAIELMRLLQKSRLTVSVTLTKAATEFICPLSFESLDASPVYAQMFSSDDGQPFGHLTPGAVADAFVIAPATATTMARLATGLADEILSAQALAFPKPLVLAPAMNPRMWNNATTQANVHTLRDRGHRFVLPESGLVACGDEGLGKLADLWDIYLETLRALSPQDLSGKTVMVTLGPTQELWDGVRCWTNLSTGRMGASIVEAAYLRGARVIALAGPGVPRLPALVERHNVTSAKDMFAAAQSLWPEADAGVFAAAVADFSPVSQGSGKFKKQSAGESMQVSFSANPDILATLAASRKKHQKVIGFAAETSDLETNVTVKLERKKADMVVGNLVGPVDSGFGGSRNTVLIKDAQGRSEAWPALSKADVSWRIFDWLLTL